MKVLVVTNPFGDYKVGDRIVNPDKIAEILSGGNAHSVVKSEHEDEAAPIAVTEKIAKKEKA